MKTSRMNDENDDGHHMGTSEFALANSQEGSSIDENDDGQSLFL